MTCLNHFRAAFIGGSALLLLAAIVAVATFTASGTLPPTRLPQSLTNPNPPSPTDAHPEPTHAALLHRDATERALLPPDKQARDDIAATRQAAVIQMPAKPAMSSEQIAMTPIPTPISLTGIVDSRQNPFHRKQAAENSYFGSLNGEHIAIFAGASEKDTLQGVVGVARGQVGSNTDDVYQEYLTPTKHGWVRITAVNGSQVSLVAKDGTPFVFDFATRTFV